MDRRVDRPVFRLGDKVEVWPIDNHTVSLTVKIGDVSLRVELGWQDAQALASGLDFWLTSGISPFQRGPLPADRRGETQ